MNIVVFDDNKWTLKETLGEVKKTMSEKHSGVSYTVTGFSNSFHIESWLDENEPDVAILDISIPEDENFGIKLAKKLRKQYETCHIVFITSNESKISQIFSGLIRPTQFIIKNSGYSELHNVLDEIVLSDADKGNVIMVSYGRNEYMLNTSNIITVQKDGRKTVVTLADRQISVSNSMSSISRELPEIFVWADKGVIINLKMIKEIDYPNKKIIMRDEEIVYMSRNAAAEIKKALKNII